MMSLKGGNITTCHWGWDHREVTEKFQKEDQSDEEDDENDSLTVAPAPVTCDEAKAALDVLNRFLMETDTHDSELRLHSQYRKVIQSKTNQKLRQVTLERFFKWSTQGRRWEWQNRWDKRYLPHPQANSTSIPVTEGKKKVTNVKLETFVIFLTAMKRGCISAVIFFDKILIQTKTNPKLRQVTLDRFFKRDRI